SSRDDVQGEGQHILDGRPADEALREARELEADIVEIIAARRLDLVFRADEHDAAARGRRRGARDLGLVAARDDLDDGAIDGRRERAADVDRAIAPDE